MKPIRTAIFGTGFMGRVHLEALRRVAGVDIAAITGRNKAAAQKLGEGYGIPYLDAAAIFKDSSIEAVHICTPNAQHFPMAKEALLAGKHVLCEKPLATTVEEGAELVSLAKNRNLRACVCQNLRYYPMVQQMRAMREAGDLGEILVVQGTYSQDWLLYDTDWNWRIDSKAGGPLRCMADIGSHWFDTIEHLTGLRVTRLCTDLQTFHSIRKQPTRPVETFANKTLGAADYIDTPVDTEDFGAVIFHLGKRARGAMTASQVSAGRKNGLRIEIYGTKSSAAWAQERPDELWIGNRDDSNRIFIKDPALLKEEARPFADLPGGHSEGYDNTFKQIFRRFYSSISDLSSALDYPAFSDGLRQLRLLDAEMESHRTRKWIEVTAS